MEIKDQLVKEILERLKKAALSEARIMLEAHKTTGMNLTEISDASLDTRTNVPVPGRLWLRIQLQWGGWQ